MSADVANPLIAARKDTTTAYSGVGIVEGLVDLRNGIENGSWIDTAIGGFGTSMEVLVTCVDPIGSIVSWGVAWLIEHVKPLSDALDWLAGDPDQITAYAQTWHNVSQHVSGQVTALSEAVRTEIATWTGPASEAYRRYSDEHVQHLTGLADAAGLIGTVVEGAGLLVALVRELVRDLIADFVSVLAVRLWQWLAEAGLTLGAATPLVAAQVSALVAKWAAKVAGLLTALARSVSRLRPILSKLGELLDTLRTALNGLRRTPGGADPTDMPATGPGTHGYNDPAGGGRGGEPSPWARQDGPAPAGAGGEPGPVGGGPAPGGAPGGPGPGGGPPHDGGRGHDAPHDGDTARGAEEPPDADGPDTPESGSTTDPAVPDHASEAELRLLGREVHSMTELDPGGHVNDAYDVTFTDGTHGVYKPNVPENEFVQVRSTIPENELAAREVAAARLDEDLGFGLVPTTARWDGPHGAGSMQEFVENASPGRPANAYPAAEGERMAVLDYVSGNTDRHMGNYLTGPDGRLVAIDHGYSFPESNAEPLRSDFVQQQMNRPLSPETMAQIQATDPAVLADRLRGTGLSEQALAGAMDRFNEIRSRGMITGEAWNAFRPPSPW
ncbi:WXG100-like domain-containing protein [Micromonospora arborensis]|uniref:WXG100-like domain-containing protein n=1 Tax=Micromonospora arborensis TaxID=2116518 RepID=UPI00371A656F